MNEVEAGEAEEEEEQEETETNRSRRLESFRMEAAELGRKEFDLRSMRCSGFPVTRMSESESESGVYMKQ